MSDERVEDWLDTMERSDATANELRDAREKIEAEIDRLRKRVGELEGFTQEFVRDFETDFVLNGVVVDEVHWGPLVGFWKEARRALNPDKEGEDE